MGKGSAAFLLVALALMKTPAGDACGWQVAASPHLGDSLQTRALLRAVTAAGPRDAWAVGGVGAFGTADQQPLFEHWNGTRWHVVTGARADFGLLLDVAHVSGTKPAEFWAVGDYSPDSFATVPLVERWNGAHWSMLPALPGLSSHASLSAVVPFGPRDVWVLGYQTVGSTPDGGALNHPLAAHWNGNGWTLPELPIPGGYGFINGADASSASSLLAVGFRLDLSGQNGDNALVERWNGSRWNANVLPLEHVELRGVSALSRKDAWAVGGTSTGSHATAVFARLHDGSWRPVAAAPTSRSLDLHAVEAVGDTRAWAVGEDANGHAVIERWNGSSWEFARVPAVPDRGSATVLSTLVGVSSVPHSRQLWAVGDAIRIYRPFETGDTTVDALILRHC